MKGDDTIFVYKISSHTIDIIARVSDTQSSISSIAVLPDERIILFGVDRFQIPNNGNYQTIMMEAQFEDVEYLHL